VKQPEIIVHNELTDDNQDFVTGKFCAPIFICDQNGTLLKRDNELLAKENNYPNIRNGTLTFIKYNDVIYGITCRHVVEALNKYNEINKKHWLDNYHVSGQLPDVAQMHFFIPKNEYQIHINSDFYFIRGDEFTNEYPDIAITVIDRNVLKLSNRVPIDIQDVDNNFIINSDTENMGAIAVGYPELLREIGDTNTNLISELKISVVNIVANIASVTSNKVRLLSELREVDPKVNNLSGMSGGPILGTNEERWGLIGIITQARDIQPKNDSFFTEPTVWIEGEKIDIKLLESWITAIPKIFNFKQSLTKCLYMPSNFKG